MLIKDSYLLTASHTFDLKERQEITVNIALMKEPPCYHTLLLGKVLYKDQPINRAVVKVYDSMFKPLFYTTTNSLGLYRFHNILAPGKYYVAAAADGYQTTKMRCIVIKKNTVTRVKFQLRKCSILSNGIIYGKVREAGSKKPIEGATIYLKDDHGMVYQTTSNRDGQYIIYNIRPKQYKLIVRKSGYLSSKLLTIEVNKNDRIMLYIDLKKRSEGFNKMISGVVTCDDKPVPDVAVFLYQLGKEGYETIVKIQETNEEGAFLFLNLSEGTYILKGKLQTGSKFEKKIILGKMSK